jgi:acetylglutamate kinase
VWLVPGGQSVGTGIGAEADIAYNVNAGVAAGRIAGELCAARVLFLTDIAGVLDKEMKLIKSLTVAQIEGLIEDRPLREE